MMSERKRVLIIDNLAVEAARRNLYREMAKKAAFEIHLLVPDVWGETTHAIQCEPESDTALHLHRTGILFGFRHHRVVYARLFQILKQVRPDFLLAVHAPENYAALQLLAARAFFFPTMKIGLFASRNIDLPSVGFPFKFAFLNRLCDRITARSKVDVVYHRPETYGHLYRRYTVRTVYIPHSVDCSVFKPDSPEMPERCNAFTVGYVGRLAEEKGVHILIQAFAMLPERTCLAIVGNGPQLERLQIMAKSLGIAERVEFQASIPYAAMPETLNRLDVLVLPSLETSHWSELFGRVLIEAMACEVPVVASASGGIRDVVGDAGVLFKSGSVDDLAKELLDLLGDQINRVKLGKKGRERVLRSFDTQIVAGALAQDIYRNLQQ